MFYGDVGLTVLWCDRTDCIYNSEGRCCLVPEEYCFGEFPYLK